MLSLTVLLYRLWISVVVVDSEKQAAVAVAMLRCLDKLENGLNRIFRHKRFGIQKFAKQQETPDIFDTVQY